MGNCWTICKEVCSRKACCYKQDDDESQELECIAGGNVHLITKISSWEEKLSQSNRDGKILAVNFSAAWCGPCRTIALVYRKLADTYPSIIFVTVDVDELAELSSSWDIKATPTIFFLKDGRPIDKLVGANKTELQKKTADIANRLPS